MTRTHHQIYKSVYYDILFLSTLTFKSLFKFVIELPDPLSDDYVRFAVIAEISTPNPI